MYIRKMQDIMGQSIFSKIFSISDYSETHKIMYIFGIKLKFPKPEYTKKQKSNPYESYKKNNIEITKIPPATGQTRDIQLANLELLKELDYVCKQSNLTYWLDYGTLLGAVRHKGFIPWDDDVDTGMMRQDYEKLYEVFDKTKRNPDITVKIAMGRKCNTILKVCHKKCDYIFADVFSYDYAPIRDKNQGEKISAKLKKYNRQYFTQSQSFEELENRIRQTISTFDNGNENDGGVVYGVEFGHIPKNWFFSKDILFPLSELEFEGCKFPVFKDYKKYLEQIYGDYMAYPKKFGMGHTMYLELSDNDKNFIAEITGKKE